MDNPCTIDEAMRLADEVTPSPARAHEALKALRAEVMHRWEQRTALSFRLQDLRDAAIAHGVPDDSVLYNALHDATATAEAWMHPGTLSEATAAHLARLKKRLDEVPTPSADLRVITWLLSDDTGISSKCICRVLAGGNDSDSWFHNFVPSDAGDFGRCYRLLGHIPEWKHRLPEVSARYPRWGPLVAAWDEVSLMYEAYVAVDEPDREARRTLYAPLGELLYKLEQEGYAADGWINTSAGCWKKPATEPPHV